jgi:hypothetical protein
MKVSQFIIIALLLVASSVRAQEVNFVSVDIDKVSVGKVNIRTGEIKTFGVVPGVRDIAHNATFDKKDNYLIFLGDSMDKFCVNVVDMSTGSLKYRYVVKNSKWFWPCVEYDNKARKLYLIVDSAVYSMNVDGSGYIKARDINGLLDYYECLVSFDPSSGSFIGEGNYNTIGGFIKIRAGKSSDIKFYKNSSTNAMDRIQFDTITHRLYGLSVSLYSLKFGYCDTSMTTFVPLSSMEEHYTDQCSNALDIRNGLYTYVRPAAFDIKESRIITIDAETGQILYSPIFDVDKFGLGKIHIEYSDVAYNSLRGIVFTSSGNPMIHSMIYMISLNKDSSIKNIDSLMTDSSGHYRFLTNDSMVYLYASPDTSLYTDQLPTWYDTATYFNASHTVKVTGTVNLNWHTVEGSRTHGGGWLSGIVYNCAACKTNDPAAGLKLILADKNNKPQRFTVTDSAGHFRFANLPLGQYQFWADKVGVDNRNSDAKVIIDNAVSSRSDISLVLYPNTLSFETTGINNSKSEDFRIYPNPASQQLRILSASSIVQGYTITDMTGRIIISDNSGSLAGETTISLTSLSPGMYFLNVRTANGVAKYKFVKQ